MPDVRSTAPLRVFTFSSDWGLATNGPFALKLPAGLELAGIPYERVVENNSSKGPEGKGPWIELPPGTRRRPAAHRPSYPGPSGRGRRPFDGDVTTGESLAPSGSAVGSLVLLA